MRYASERVARNRAGAGRGVRWAIRLGMAVLLAVALVAAMGGTAFADVRTDKYVYVFLEWVQISGDGMLAGEPVTVEVLYPDATLAQSRDVAADDAGAFSDSYQLPEGAPGGIYTVVATGQTSGTRFTCEFDPQARADEYWVEQGATLTVAAPGVLANDAGLKSVSLGSGPSHQVAFSLASNGGFSYTATSTYVGSDSFVYNGYQQNDPNTPFPATVTIHVTYKNLAPTANAQSVTTPEDTAKSITLSATDPNSDALTYSIVSGPSHGSLSGTAPNVTYTPTANDNGSDQFTFRVTDPGGLSSNAVVSITVTAVNDAPIASGASVTTAEDTAYSGTVTASDVDSALLTYAKASDPAHGGLVVNIDGTFTYTPDANYNGTDSFTFKANDGTVDSAAATIEITVTAVNDAPVANSASVTTAEDTPRSGHVTGADVDGESLNYAAVSGPTHGTLVLNASGAFTYTPYANYNGTDSFTFKANDGTVDSAPAAVNITVNAVNDAPVANSGNFDTDEDTPYTETLSGIDVEASTLTFATVDDPVHGSLTLGSDGAFTYTPASDYNGPDSFTFKVSDGDLDSAPAAVNITVNAVNDAPTIDTVADLATPWGDEVTFTAAGHDIDSIGLLYSLSAGAPGSIDANSGVWTWTPGRTDVGERTFDVIVSDGSLTAQTFVKVTVAKRQLTITAVTQSREYDGTTGSSAIPLMTGTLGAGDAATRSQSFDTKHAGTGKTLTASIIFTSGSESDYAITYESDTTGVITQAPLTISAATDTKTYDGSTASDETPTHSDLEGDDTVSALAQAFDSKNAGPRTLSVTAYTVDDGNGGANYEVALEEAEGTIDPREITVTAQHAEKTYDDTTDCAVAPLITAGELVTGESANLSQTFDTRHVGTGKRLIPAIEFVSPALGGNYSVRLVSDTTGVITQAPLTISAVTDTKVYNGSAMSNKTPTHSDLAGDDTVTNLRQAFDSPNAGARTLSVIAYAVSDGNRGANYRVTLEVAEGTIEKRPITITAQPAEKIYDDTTDCGVAPLITSGALVRDEVAVFSQTFDTQHVGTGKTLAPAIAFIAPALGGNYAITYESDTTGVITQAPLTISAATDTKTYDGSTASDETPTYSDLEGDDTVSALAQAFDSKNAGPRTLSVTAYTVDDGNGGLNYSVTTKTAAGTITAAPLEIAAVTDSKTYDGTRTSAGLPSVGTIFGTDHVGGLAQAFDSKNAGPRTLSVTAYTVDDSNGGLNYSVTTKTAAGTISAAPLEIAAVTDSKTYDGTKVSAGVPSVGTMFGTDHVGGLSQEFASDDVLGTGGSTLQIVAGFTVDDGNGGLNYSVTTKTAAGTITPRDLTITATGIDKVYDSTTAATVNLSDNRVSGDVLTDSRTSAVFDDEHVGTWDVEVSGISISGADAGNYNLLNTTASTSAEITKRDLTVTATADDKVFDDTTAAVAHLDCDKIAPDGVAPDDVALSYLAATFSDKKADTDKTVTVTGISISGDDAGNYNLLNETATTTADITKAVTSLVASASSAQYSDPSSLVATVSPKAIGDSPIDGTVEFHLGGNLIGSGHVDSNGRATATYVVTDPAGTYVVTAKFISDDANFAGSTGTTNLIVTKEDAVIAFDKDNPAATQVTTRGGSLAGPVAFIVWLSEPAGDTYLGEWTKGVYAATLTPVSTGGDIAATSITRDGDKLTITFAGPLTVNAYTLAITVGGSYYTGYSEDGFTVYDPSLGFATGGGWFYWPNTADPATGYKGDKTNFGFVMKYGKNGGSPKGSVLVIRHLADGGLYRLKSNALDALALQNLPGLGTASIVGKATYQEPGWSVPKGGAAFTFYAEDRNEPGTGNDSAWVQVKVGGVIQKLSLAPTGAANAVTIGGGNIASPHQAPK